MSEDHGERLARVEARLCGIEKRALEWLTRAEFTPVKMIAYGLAGSILLGVVSAILSLVLRGAVK